MQFALKSITDLMHRADPKTDFKVTFWDGRAFNYGKSPPPKFHLEFKSPDALRHTLGNGFLGFGESYMQQEVDLHGDISELIRLGIAAGYRSGKISLKQKARLAWHGIRSRCSQACAPRNISYHYDLGNDFYRLFLDRSMTYSCAYFRDWDNDLDQAQADKYEHICRKLCLQPGERLLDIGCGWGGMLIHAARHYDIKGVGLTLSREQHDYANLRIKELGLEGRVEVRLQDYRQVESGFDKIVSIGMFEHVGKGYIPVFMDRLGELLKDGGLGLLHTIGKDTPSPVDPWILKYIFPGGYLPTLTEVSRHMGQRSLSVLDFENLRPHYARTLDKWAEKFESNVDKVRDMFDESFVRRWRLYLISCAGQFRHGDIRLFQFLFSNGLNNRLPHTRDHIYDYG